MNILIKKHVLLSEAAELSNISAYSKYNELGMHARRHVLISVSITLQAVEL